MSSSRPLSSNDRRTNRDTGGDTPTSARVNETMASILLRSELYDIVTRRAPETERRNGTCRLTIAFLNVPFQGTFHPNRHSRSRGRDTRWRLS